MYVILIASESEDSNSSVNVKLKDYAPASSIDDVKGKEPFSPLWTRLVSSGYLDSYDTLTFEDKMILIASTALIGVIAMLGVRRFAFPAPNL